ncbi:MAG: DNA polymerase Y family protein [Verrucomicrobiales bacterium]|nr:DNA polymerase Y family protein [Verrucomicrobiales bacterium]
MFASLHIPRPGLQALFIEKPTNRYQPAVLLDEAGATTTSKRDRGKLRVLEISAEAEEFGIHPGMTAVQAQARCDYLLLLNRSPAAEKKLSEILLDCAEAFTPDFEDTEPGTCVMDLGGVAAIERDALRIAHRMRELLEEKGYFSQVGLAPNPDLAVLASRAVNCFADGEPVLVLHEEAIAATLAPLPVELLELTPALSDLFDLWGVRTLGELAKLSRSDLVERLGEEAGNLWDQAGGRSRRLLRLVRPVPEFTGKMDLEHEVTTVEPLVFMMRRILETISARLCGAYLVAAKLSLRFELADGQVYQRVFRIPEPCADVDRLLGILQAHLENFEVRAPVAGLTLRAIPSRPGKHQFDLFAAGVKDPNRLSETLGRVEALLGSERFGVPRLRPTHLPDSLEMRSFEAGKEPVGGVPDAALVMERLPMRRYRPRRHVRVVCGGDCTGYNPGLYPVQSPTVQGTVSEKGGSDGPPVEIISGDFKGRIIESRGPFSISGNWWEKLSYWRREEWDVQHENGRMYRLVKEKGEWFVEAAG